MKKNSLGNILIVDDNKIDRSILGSILRSNNYNSIAINSGMKILEVLESNSVDLIILDIMMPVIDGFEVCKIIKSDKKFSNIPIIFLTVVQDKENILKGFELGAQDYISKPFNSKELIARIKVHVKLKKSEEILARVNHDLQDFMYIASHDLQSPLVSMSGFATMFIENVSDKLTEEELFPIRRIEANSRKMQDLIKSLLDVSRLNTEKNEFSEIQCNEVLDSIINTLDINISENNVNIVRNNIPNIFGDKIRIEVLSRNIISNAIKYGGKNIEIGFDESKKAFYVKDDGVGIDPEQLENVFKPGSRLQTVKIEGVGMGLSFCKKVVELHHGEIWAESEGKGKGTTIWMKFQTQHDE